MRVITTPLGTRTRTGTASADGNLSLDDRVRQLEEARDPPWLRLFKDAGIVVGCVCGVIGGFATLSDKVGSYFPSPKIAVTTGGQLELHTTPQGGAEIRYGLVLNNTGSASGTFNTQSARLEVLDAAPDTAVPMTPPVHLHSGDTPSDVPFGVKVADLKEIQVSVDLSPDALERLIGSEGLRRVKVELMSGQQPYTSTYCFWLGRNLVEQFRAQGKVLFEQQDADSKCAAASR